MPTRTRKIGFYSVKLMDIENPGEIYGLNEFEYLFRSINRMQKSRRILDLAVRYKFHVLSYYRKDRDSGVNNVIFESAKYYNRPPLIHRATADARDNPKTLDEGEAEKTHVSFLVKDDEILLVMEERRDGISIQGIKAYLEHYLDEIYSQKAYYMEVSVIAKNDFLEELNRLNRTIQGEVFVEKRLLGSECMNISERYEEAKERIAIVINAKRNRSITDILRDGFHSMIAGDQNITRVRARGKDSASNQIILDTDLIRKIERLEIQMEAGTGLVTSSEIFRRFASFLSEESE